MRTERPDLGQELHSVLPQGRHQRGGQRGTDQMAERFADPTGYHQES